MGLGGSKTVWQRQTKDFGHGQNTNRDQSTKYSCLVFDNRGVGKSDKPLTRYSTSEMAKDTLELVDHVGWTSLHVIGVSMGGMIAQELVRMSNHGVFMIKSAQLSNRLTLLQKE
jgi:pimeloyl-ACP methyl ester carboxylesterase